MIHFFLCLLCRAMFWCSHGSFFVVCVNLVVSEFICVGRQAGLEERHSFKASVFNENIKNTPLCEIL